MCRLKRSDLITSLVCRVLRWANRAGDPGDGDGGLLEGEQAAGTTLHLHSHNLLKIFTRCIYIYIYRQYTFLYSDFSDCSVIYIYKMFCSCRVRLFGAGSLRTVNMSTQSPRGRLAATHPADRKIGAAGVIFLASTDHLPRRRFNRRFFNLEGQSHRRLVLLFKYLF